MKNRSIWFVRAYAHLWWRAKMKRAYGLAGAAALLMGLSAPAFADMDVTGMTCGGFMALDQNGRTAFATDMILWMNDSANASAAAGLAAMYGGSGGAGDADALHKAIEGHCNGEGGSENILEVLQEATK
jgi:hypothetical protein